MEDVMLSGVTAAVVLVLAASFLFFPRIARRGLLFGVYVGEETAVGAEARRLKRRWTLGILAWIALAVGAQWLVTTRRGPLDAYAAALVILVLGYAVEYVRSYRAARALAVAAPSPVAVAYVGASTAPRPVLAYLALAFSVGAGLLAVGYTWWHLDDLPARIPVHFGASGRPDQYRPASFGSIWMLPLMTLVEGTMLSLFALLVARAKRAVRRGDGGLSLAAQERFRAAMSGVLAVVAMMTTGLLAVLSVGSVRVAIGQAQSLPALVPVLVILLVGAAVGGMAVVGLRFGQGGARLETAAGAAPLTDGLADNRRWVLGMFYVNRDDPSFFVEHRFGFGYTINLGNRKAVLILIVFLGLMIGLGLLPLIH